VTSEISRIVGRKYSELADDARVMKQWTKVQVAEKARELAPDLDIKNEQVYDWFEGKCDPRSSFTKLMETVLGINLPYQCYYNVGKR